MPSNNIESRFSAVLQSIAQSILPNYSCLFGSWDDVDRLIDHATYPAILNILSVSGGGFFRHGRVYERESVLLAFVDEVPRDADGAENINAVDRMRTAMRTFVTAINASGVFVPIASYNYTTIYESGANIHTGVMVELLLEDANGTCGDNLDPSAWHIPMGQMVDLTSYLLKEDAQAIYAPKSSIPSLIGYATEKWVKSQGYLTEHQSLDGYATEVWVNGQGFVKQEDLAGYATQEWVRQQGYMSGGYYYTKGEVNTALATKADKSDLDDYATKEWTLDRDFLTEETDPTVPSWAKQPTKPAYTAQEVGALPDTTPIPVVPTKVSAFDNDAEYLTQHQSLDGYATEDWVEEQGYLTEHQDISGKLDVDATAKKTATIPYAVVDSTSTAKVFTAQVAGITELVDGTCVMLRNSVVTSAAGFTININGLGAHPAFSNMTLATADTTIFNINYTMLFVYCANVTVSNVKGAWCCYRGYDSNTTTNSIGYQLRGNNATLPVSDTARYYKIYFKSADGTKWVPASVNSTNNATSARAVNQRPIDPFGEIVYTSANANYAAGASLSAGTAWHQYAVTLGYSFNRTGEALTLSFPKAVYLKCAPQADGSAIMDADTPIVQDLPTTEDGKIYIYLGISYSATAIELRYKHPVYYYKDGAIRLWTNAPVSSGGSGGGGILPLAFNNVDNITDSTLIAKWDEMMAEATTKGNTNVSPLAYFIFSRLDGMGNWCYLSNGYIQSDCNSVRFGDWVIEKQNGELTMYYND